MTGKGMIETFRKAKNGSKVVEVKSRGTKKYSIIKDK